MCCHGIFVDIQSSKTIKMVVTVDQVKYVVNELNSRLKKKINVISYDNFKNEQRIEILLQVFQEIDPTVSPIVIQCTLIMLS